MFYSDKALTTADILRNLGTRFREYRMRLRMTRRDVSIAADVGMTTLYKFETGNMTDISFDTIIRLLRAIGLTENWSLIIPDLPESPYLYNSKNQKAQRIRHPRS